MLGNVRKREKATLSASSNTESYGVWECEDEAAGVNQPDDSGLSSGLTAAAGMIAATAMLSMGETGRDGDEAAQRRSETTDTPPITSPF